MMMVHLLRIPGLIAVFLFVFVKPLYSADNAELMSRLVSSYPEFLAGHEGNELIWKDGTRMRFDDGRTGKDFETLLNSPSVKDMFYAPYIPGKAAASPGVNMDPGRVRHEPFFLKMYGNCKKGETARTLVEVVWLPRKWGKKIRVTP